MRVLVTGATGFVGRNITKGLIDAGHSVKALVHDRSRASSFPSQNVEAVEGDIKDLNSLIYATRGVDAVIHLVGIIKEKAGQTFEDVHVEGTRHVILAMLENRIKRLLHMSALGTREDGLSMYHKTKWWAEELVRESDLDYTIFRPSIIFGPGDGFTKQLVDILKKAPVAPVIGDGKHKLAPISIDDVVACYIAALTGRDHIGKTYELCGPDALTLVQVTDKIKAALGMGKPDVRIPIWAARPAAAVMEKILPDPPLTRDQLTMLEEDNTCTHNAITEVFGITPKNYEPVVREAAA